MSELLAVKYPRAYRAGIERFDGQEVIDGKTCRAKWKPIFTVTVEFDSKEDADDFFSALYEGEIVTANNGAKRHD